MAKKNSGKTYVSKGERRNVSSNTRAAMKAARPASDRQINILDAWKKGKNPWITIENPNKNEKGKKFIRVRLTTLKGGTFKDIEKKNYMV